MVGAPSTDLERSWRVTMVSRVDALESCAPFFSPFLIVEWLGLVDLVRFEVASESESSVRLC
jgi:hypothetical protein